MERSREITVKGVGFDLKEIKTKDIAISTKYDSVERNGEYKRLFSGYNFSANMLVRFDFDSKKLASVFSCVAASGVKLGKLLCINYNWDEIIIHSSTRLEYGSFEKSECCCSDMDFTPDDIPVEDGASFVWEIVD